MIDKPKDDISAFPILNSHFASEKGMTLRDWFAGQALSGLASHDSLPWVTAVQMAYRAADLMLAERKR